MKLNDLNEATTTIVNFSDLGEFDNWDARFWSGLKKSITQYKKDGKDKTIKKISAAVEKMGEKNYNAMKNVADKEKFSVPAYETVIDPKKLKSNRQYRSNGVYVILLDLVTSRASERKKKLQADLKALQKEIEKLG
jgi:hypothetical protein